MASTRSTRRELNAARPRTAAETDEGGPILAQTRVSKFRLPKDRGFLDSLKRCYRLLRRRISDQSVAIANANGAAAAAAAGRNNRVSRASLSLPISSLRGHLFSRPEVRETGSRYAQHLRPNEMKSLCAVMMGRNRKRKLRYPHTYAVYRK